MNQRQLIICQSTEYNTMQIKHNIMAIIDHYRILFSPLSPTLHNLSSHRGRTVVLKRVVTAARLFETPCYQKEIHQTELAKREKKTN